MIFLLLPEPDIKYDALSLFISVSNLHFGNHFDTHNLAPKRASSLCCQQLALKQEGYSTFQISSYWFLSL